MDEDTKKELEEYLAGRYFLVRRHSIFYVIGGFVAVAVAIVGITWASARSFLQSGVARQAEGITVTRYETNRFRAAPFVTLHL